MKKNIFTLDESGVGDDNAVNWFMNAISNEICYE